MTSGGTCTSPRPAKYTLDKCVCVISALLGGLWMLVARPEWQAASGGSPVPKSAAKVERVGGCAGCAGLCGTSTQKKHPIGVLEKIRAKA